MREIEGDLLAPPPLVRMICIPTNGSISKQGSAVMGKGVALKAQLRWLGIDAVLGPILAEHGNHVHLLSRRLGGPSVFTYAVRGFGLTDSFEPFHVATFPTKSNWFDKTANIRLIEQSARELVALVDREFSEMPSAEIALPRVGAGLDTGRLDWNIVRGILVPILADDRFLILTPPGNPTP